MTDEDRITGRTGRKRHNCFKHGVANRLHHAAEPRPAVDLEPVCRLAQHVQEVVVQAERLARLVENHRTRYRKGNG